MNVSSLTTSLARRCRIATATNQYTKKISSVNVNMNSATSSYPSTTTNSLKQCRSITSLATLRTNNLVSASTSTTTTISSPWNSQHLFQSILTPMNKAIAPTTTINTIQKRTMASQKHKRIIKMAKGYRGRSKNTFRAAIRRVEKGLQYAYRDRKVRKRNFRKLWIQRINAGVRQHGMSYSRFVNGMLKMSSSNDGGKKIVLNRKVLADLAANEPFSFKAVVDVVKMNSPK